MMRKIGISTSAHTQLKSPTLVVFFLTVIVLFYIQRQHGIPRPIDGGYNHIPSYRPPVPRLAKVSMLYGKSQPIYERAIASQERHAAIHGYPVHILRNDMQEGYWNKPAYILSIILRELEKPPGQRIEWLMWFDGDSLIMNPSIPTTTYLPPNDDDDLQPQYTHLLVTKDVNGLNTGIFFIRVHEWSVRFLIKTLAVPQFRPEIDLGASADQRAMEFLINDTEFRANTTFVPKTWINSYLDDFQRGDMILHFPGMLNRDWHMRHWLDLVEARNADQEWAMPEDRISPAEQADQFWNRVKGCRRVSGMLAHRFDEEDGEVPEELKNAIEWMRETCWYLSDNEMAISDATRRVDEAMKLLSMAV